MGYRDILVQIDERPASVGRAAAAAALAARQDSRLTGVFLRSNGPVGGRVGAMARASETARMIFEGAAIEAGVLSDWLVVDGERDGMVACARRFDLTVFPMRATASRGQYDISAAAVGLASGGPLVIVPDRGAEPTCGERVLIAWNGSWEAARAVRDAWPVIRRARSVYVLAVSPEGAERGGGLLPARLDHHGCRATLIVERTDEARAGEILREQAGVVNADLIVMGLHGRMGRQDVVLGDVSRDLLGWPPCALLVSH